MQRYSINTPLVAIRLCPGSDGDTPGVLCSLSQDATVEVIGPCGIAGMVEVVWEGKRYAVFELDLANRAQPYQKGTSME